MHIGEAGAFAHSSWKPAPLSYVVYRRRALRVRVGATWHQEADALSLRRDVELERWRPLLTCWHLPSDILGQHPHAGTGEPCAGRVMGPIRLPQNRIRAASSRV